MTTTPNPPSPTSTTTRFVAGSHSFSFPGPTIVMGILNITPDSFSDGGLYLTPDSAIRHAAHLLEAGAGIIDVGGESTRPGAQPVPEAEELQRVIPVIKTLASRYPVPISIDTRKPSVARAALEAGATIVNDIHAHRSSPDLWHAIAQARAGYVCMHMQGSPETMQLNPSYNNVVQEIDSFFQDRLLLLTQAGLHPDQVLLDVGIGFGKTLEHNLQLLATLHHFKRHGRPLLLGVSRKSFIGNLLGVDVKHRLPGSLACACWATLAGTQFVRAHDVAETVQALRMIEAIRSHTA